MNAHLTRNIWRMFCASIAFTYAVSAEAASFDCAKAQSKVEHIICDNPEISKLDEEMAGMYIAILKASSTSSVLKKTQRDWLGYRQTCLGEEYKGKEGACLSYLYQHHNRILRGGLPTIPDNENGAIQLCAHIAELVETGEALKLELNDWVNNPPRGKKYKLDIDGDGIVDSLEIGCGSGECSAEIKLSSSNPYDLSGLDDGYGFYLIRYQSSIYALVSYSEDEDSKDMSIRHKYHLGRLYLISPIGAKLMCGN